MLRELIIIVVTYLILCFGLLVVILGMFVAFTQGDDFIANFGRSVIHYLDKLRSSSSPSKHFATIGNETLEGWKLFLAPQTASEKVDQKAKPRTKRKAYAIVNINIQREVEFELDEVEVDEQAIVEQAVAAKYGELNFDGDTPDEIEIVEIDYAD